MLACIDLVAVCHEQCFSRFMLKREMLEGNIRMEVGIKTKISCIGLVLLFGWKKSQVQNYTLSEFHSEMVEFSECHDIYIAVNG